MKLAAGGGGIISLPAPHTPEEQMLQRENMAHTPLPNTHRLLCHSIVKRTPLSPLPTIWVIALNLQSLYMLLWQGVKKDFFFFKGGFYVERTILCPSPWQGRTVLYPSFVALIFLLRVAGEIDLFKGGGELVLTGLCLLGPPHFLPFSLTTKPQRINYLPPPFLSTVFNGHFIASISPLVGMGGGGY